MLQKLAKLEKFPYFTHHGPELEYFLGYTGSNGYLLILSQTQFLFFTDGRYFEAYRELYPDEIRKIAGGVKIYQTLAEILKENGFSSLYLHPGYLNYEEALELKRFLKPMALRKDAVSVMQLRKVKSYAEIKKVKAAIALADEGLAYLMAWLKEGVSEKRAAAELEYYLKIKGADDLSFSSIVLFGENTAYPHGVPGDRTLKKGDVVLIDLGVKKDHYCSDMTRTFCFKKAPEGFAEHYRLLLSLQERTLAMIRPNIKASVLDLSLRQGLKEAGLLEFYTHSLGHGVGVEVHEAPALSYLKEKETLQKGNLFTIEPGIYLPGKYGIRIEDMVYLNGKGQTEILTDFPKELLIKP